MVTLGHPLYHKHLKKHPLKMDICYLKVEGIKLNARQYDLIERLIEIRELQARRNKKNSRGRDLEFIKKKMAD